MAQEKSQDAPRVKNVVVETTGDFMKTDVSANQQVEADRPSLVKRTAFIQMQLDNGQLRMVDDEPSDDLTDQDIAKKWEKDGKYKGSKKVKQKAPEAGSALNPSEVSPLAPPAPNSIPKGAPQQPGESDDAYLARLDKEKGDNK